MPTTDRLRTALGERYAIEREIGAGGMATVFLARDVRHDREVAIKILRADLAAVLGTERFLAEVRIAARLDHPHILTLIDSGEAEGILFYVMPFVRGESLRTKLTREKQLGIEEALTITRQVASALEYAHAKGIIHRDIKPENILLHEGEAVLADFGIALAVREAGANRLTETGLSLGTPQYMSPEQATGDRVLDARSDVYSLGAVLYEMLGGEPPVTGATAQAMIAKLLTERPTSLRVVRDTVSAALERAVMKALAKVPADRFGSAAEFARAISMPGPGSEGAPSARRPLLAIVAAVAVLAVVAGGVAWIKSGSRTSTTTSATIGTRTQVTFTGRVSQAAISSDAKTIAYRVEDCTRTECTYAIEIQDIGGGATRRIVDGGKAVHGLSWSPDRRTVMFRAELDGSFARMLVSTLGGQPTPITRGLDNADFYTSDSVVATVSTGRGQRGDLLILSLDGVIRDRIRVVDSTEQFNVADVMWVADSPWFVALLTSPDGGRFEYRVVDRKGRRVAQPPNNRRSGTTWASADALWRMLVLEGQPGQRALERISFDRATGLLSAKSDTVYRGKADFFSVTRDGSAIVLNEGSTTNEVYALTLPDLFAGNMPEARRIAATTSFAAGDLSPDGERVLMARDVGGQIRLTVRPFEGGAETTLPLAGAVYSDWVDSVTVQFIASKGSGSQLGLIDVRTGASRDTLNIPDAVAFGNPLPFAFIPPHGWAWRPRESGFVVQRAGDAKPRLIPVPDAFQLMQRVAGTRDGQQIAITGLHRARDSSSIITMAPDGSSPTRWATMPGVITDLAIAELPVHFVSRSFGGLSALYRIDGPGQATRVGTIPRRAVSFSVSQDLKRAVAATSRYQGDAWLMRVNLNATR